MTDVKAILERARFNIGEGIPYEAYLIKGKVFKTADYKTKFPMIFQAKDVLIDAVMLDLRPKPTLNKWTRFVPMDVIEYCYRLVPHGRMAFVWDVEEEAKTELDRIVCVFEDRYVDMERSYAALYEEALGRLKGS